MAVSDHHTISQTALLLIDIQQGFDHPTHWGFTRSNPAFESHIVSLLAAFRSAQPHSQPNIFHVCHHSVLPSSPLHPSKEGVQFQPYAAPRDGEPVYSKTVNGSFAETALKADLRKRHIKTLYVCGLTTNHCVDTTVRMASNLHVVDFEGEEDGKVVLIADATAAFERGAYDAETVMRVHVESLRGEFCTVAETAEVLQWLEGLKTNNK